MAIISRISQILNTPIETKTVSKGHVSNPFAPGTFKGNVLTADVFETKKPTLKNKLTYSALVGSLGDAFPTFRKGVESVIAFGNRMKEGVVATFRKINEIGNMEITIDFAAPVKALKGTFNTIYDRYSVAQLRKQDVTTLETMWKEMMALNVAA